MLSIQLLCWLIIQVPVVQFFIQNPTPFLKPKSSHKGMFPKNSGKEIYRHSNAFYLATVLAYYTSVRGSILRSNISKETIYVLISSFYCFAVVLMEYCSPLWLFDFQLCSSYLKYRLQCKPMRAVHSGSAIGPGWRGNNNKSSVQGWHYAGVFFILLYFTFGGNSLRSKPLVQCREVGNT